MGVRPTPGTPDIIEIHPSQSTTGKWQKMTGQEFEMMGREAAFPQGGNSPGQVAEAFGPEQLAANLNQMWSLMSSSPYMRSIFGQILMNQNANMGMLRQGQGVTGAGQTGLGQAQQQIQQSAGAMAKTQAMGNAWQQALAATMQNMGLQASLLPAWDQIQNPRRYDPFSLQTLSGQQAIMRQQQQQQFEQQMARLYREWQLEDQGWDWGKFLSTMASVIPFI